jgi:hypothetical protein
MENITRTALTMLPDRLFTHSIIQQHKFAAHPSAITASGLPIATMFGFVPGLLMGFKKG